MEPTLTTPTETTTQAPAAPVQAAPSSDRPAFQPRDNRGDNRGGQRGGGGRGGRGGNSRGPRRDTRQKPEFDQKIVSLRRVVRVTSGGRRFAFSACVVAGNRKGMVGVGLGKATDTPLAIEKAFRDAKKNMITVNMTPNMSIPHEVEAKFAASVVKIMPAPGRGMLAGSSVRTVLELAGLKEIGAKLLSRSKNSMNNAIAAVEALDSLKRTKIKQPKIKEAVK
ncbi:MAG: rpsE [Parcubacteria group bacterium]|nr:rpsE [Parcubacteria group bacterium]